MKGIFEKLNRFDISAYKTDKFLRYPPLFHPHCELIYVNSGFVDMTVDGNEARVTEGEFTIVFPYVTHSYQSTGSSTVTVVLFDPAETIYEKEFLTKKPKSVFLRDGMIIPKLLERLCELISTGDEKTKKAAIAYLNATISEALLKTELVKANNSELDNSKKVLEYCTAHFTEQINIKSISEFLYLSESYISKIFSEKLHYSFREYINLLRIDKARKLLDTTDRRIVDIMLDCGFKNQSSFNRVFRENVGVSPLEYRKKKD